REWGAEATLNLDQHADPKERKQWVLEQTDGRGPDVIIQCAMGAAVAEGLELIRPGGRYLSIGVGPGNIPAELLARGMTIYSFVAAESRHFYEALQFLATRRKQFPFEMMISGSYRLEQINQALQAMAEYREVKPVILPGQRAD
ncbi:MAG TPA: zinc-binding dehydrogenase, partial [Dehalococcoidia bacterium]|nr:zinc-binding dehydrogenase [Dehalococcoidia bacterium]